MKTTLCSRCGRVATGYAFIGNDRYCHDALSPTCYELEQWGDNQPERSLTMTTTTDPFRQTGRTIQMLKGVAWSARTHQTIVVMRDLRSTAEAAEAFVRLNPSPAHLPLFVSLYQFGRTCRGIDAEVFLDHAATIGADDATIGRAMEVLRPMLDVQRWAA